MQLHSNSASTMLDHGWVLCLPASSEIIERVANCIDANLSPSNSQEFVRTDDGIWRREAHERRVIAEITLNGFKLFVGWDISHMSGSDQYYVTWSQRFAATQVCTTHLNGRTQIWVRTEGGVDAREVVDQMTKERYYVVQSKDAGPDHGSYALARDAVWTTGATNFECFLGGRVHLMARRL